MILPLMLLAMPAGSAAKSDPPPALGRSMANAQLFDIRGARLDIRDVKTRAVVVVFWAFWCDTWKKALPAIQELNEEKADLGCELWTVSIDGQRTGEIRPLVDAGRIRFPVLLDDETLSKALGIRRVPTVLILDRKRKVVRAFEAYPGNDAIEQAVHTVK